MNKVYELIHSICMLDNKLENFADWDQIDGMTDVQLKSLLKTIKHEVNQTCHITKSIQPDLYNPSNDHSKRESSKTDQRPSGDGFLNVKSQLNEKL